MGCAWLWLCLGVSGCQGGLCLAGPGCACTPVPGCACREGAPLTLQRVHAAVAQALRGLVREYRVAVVATKHLLLPGAVQLT